MSTSSQHAPPITRAANTRGAHKTTHTHYTIQHTTQLNTHKQPAPVVVARALPPEAREVDHVERRDVVGLSSEVRLPEAALPEAELVHVAVVVAEGRVRERVALFRRRRGRF